MNKKTELWAIALMIVCTLFTSAAQLLWKLGADRLSLDIISLITNWPIILGVISYGIGAVLLIIALRGGQVTILYPIIASSYVWVALGSSFFFGEIVNGTRWIGVGLIILGIVFINIGDRDEY